MPSGNMGRLGAVYLSSEVLWRANLEMTPYNRFLLAMREELPVVHPLGCYDRGGNLLLLGQGRVGALSLSGHGTGL